MDTVTVGAPVGRIEADGFRTHGEKPRRISPRFGAAVGALAGYIRRQPDITLGELRAAFLGTAFDWNAQGQLALSPSRMALIKEFDELIEIHGWTARADELFLQGAGAPSANSTTRLRPWDLPT